MTITARCILKLLPDRRYAYGEKKTQCCCEEKTKARINRLMAEHTGQPVEKVEADTERDNWMTAEEAKAYGLIDEIITNH